MPNPWVEHVKAWAKRNDETYTCAMSDPACKFEYYNKDKKLRKIISYRDVQRSEYGNYSKSDGTTPSKQKLKNLAEELSKRKIKDRSLIFNI
jgi:uncharacterized protein YjdB